MTQGRGRRVTGLESLASAVTAITEPVFRRQGEALGRIVADWSSIVGERLATRSLPERLTHARPAARQADGDAGRAGTLHVRIGSGAAAMEIQHLEPVILQRIAESLGWRAVTRLRLVRAPLSRMEWAFRATPPAARPQPVDPETEARLAAEVAEVADPALREVLLALGRRLSADTPGVRGGR